MASPAPQPGSKHSLDCFWDGLLGVLKFELPPTSTLKTEEPAAISPHVDDEDAAVRKDDDGKADKESGDHKAGISASASAVLGQSVASWAPANAAGAPLPLVERGTLRPAVQVKPEASNKEGKDNTEEKARSIAAVPCAHLGFQYDRKTYRLFDCAADVGRLLVSQKPPAVKAKVVFKTLEEAVAAASEHSKLEVDGQTPQSKKAVGRVLKEGFASVVLTSTTAQKEASERLAQLGHLADDGHATTVSGLLHFQCPPAAQGGDEGAAHHADSSSGGGDVVLPKPLSSALSAALQFRTTADRQLFVQCVAQWQQAAAAGSFAAPSSSIKGEQQTSTKTEGAATKSEGGSNVKGEGLSTTASAGSGVNVKEEGKPDQGFLPDVKVSVDPREQQWVTQSASLLQLRAALVEDGDLLLPDEFDALFAEERAVFFRDRSQQALGSTVVANALSDLVDKETHQLKAVTPEVQANVFRQVPFLARVFAQRVSTHEDAVVFWDALVRRTLFLSRTMLDHYSPEGPPAPPTTVTSTGVQQRSHEAALIAHALSDAVPSEPGRGAQRPSALAQCRGIDVAPSAAAQTQAQSMPPPSGPAAKRKAQAAAQAAHGAQAAKKASADVASSWNKQSAVALAEDAATKPSSSSDSTDAGVVAGGVASTDAPEDLSGSVFDGKRRREGGAPEGSDAKPGQRRMQVQLFSGEASVYRSGPGSVSTAQGPPQGPPHKKQKIEEKESDSSKAEAECYERSAAALSAALMRLPQRSDGGDGAAPAYVPSYDIHLVAAAVRDEYFHQSTDDDTLPPEIPGLHTAVLVPGPGQSASVFENTAAPSTAEGGVGALTAEEVALRWRCKTTTARTFHALRSMAWRYLLAPPDALTLLQCSTGSTSAVNDAQGRTPSEGDGDGALPLLRRLRDVAAAQGAEVARQVLDPAVVRWAERVAAVHGSMRKVARGLSAGPEAGEAWLALGRVEAAATAMCGLE